MKTELFISLYLLATSSALASELYEEFPNTIAPEERYVFYSHGLIVEGNERRPFHDDFGYYEFELIKQTLFEDEDFNLVAHQRPKDTDPDGYATQLAVWVTQLVDGGVSPENITLIGFSRGGLITLKAANSLNHLGINTAIMAVCFDGDYPSEPPFALGGHILSIYEDSDVVRSCRDILLRSDNAKSKREVAIFTGLEHGAFFKPIPEWIVPLKAWLRETKP